MSDNYVSELFWKKKPTTVGFFSVRPTKETKNKKGMLQHVKHKITFPSRQHALIFATFCSSGNIPECAFTLDQDFYDSLNQSERDFVDGGNPCTGMPDQND